MELTKDNSQASYQIQRYRTGFVTINHEEMTCPLIIMPNTLRAWDISTQSKADEVEPPTPNLTWLTPASLSIFVNLRPDVVIIGIGEKHPLLDLKIFLPLIEAQIGFEVMNSAAACRTYSLLSLEGRNVALGIIF